MHKKLFVSLLILGTGLSSSLQAQPRKTIPNKVKLAFEAQYPQAAKVEWEYEKKKQLWEIEFELEGKAYEAYYDTAGTWVKTEWNLNPDDLPDAVWAKFAKGEFRTWRIDDLEVQQHPNGETLYELELKKGRKEARICYTLDGTLVLTVVCK